MFGADAGGHYAILLAMLAPALFMTATASLLQSANNRLARVVDRLRTLMSDRSEGIPLTPAARLHHASQVGLQRQRTGLILLACRLLYMALAAFVVTSLAVAADSLLDHAVRHLPTAAAVAGVLLLLAACLCLSREAGLAVRALRQELEPADTSE